MINAFKIFIGKSYINCFPDLHNDLNASQNLTLKLMG